MGGAGVIHAAYEWEPDGTEFACRGPLAMPHGVSAPLQYPAGLSRAWRLNSECACVCVPESVWRLWGGADRKGRFWEERIKFGKESKP